MTALPGRVLVIGEALIDVVDHGDGVTRHVGGSPLNVAFGLGRLGTATTFASEFGDDPDGLAIRDHLASGGVSVVTVGDGSLPTSTATAWIGADGSATYDFDLTWNFRTPPQVNGVSVVHVGSIGALHLPGGNRVLSFVESLPQDVLVAFDPNVRPTLMPSREVAVVAVERYASRAAVVKLSDEDADWLYPDAAASAPQRLLDAGAKLVAVSRGSAGSVLHTADLRVEVPVLQVDIVDTIGAGDAYMSGLIAAIAEKVGIEGALAGSYSNAQLTEIGRMAAVSAGLTVARAGAMPPTAAELQRALRELEQ
ncbi:carbohydrate kinase [uncultured Microbacterium sp.]|uniref:carbohydrate kinase family protein n=1 Tax=uncultured Microbacterium sp. TaxID=191216 RepID=UPI0026346DE6|nr:carbohydrate kinase [uncultured Microbacterium sp.]